MVFPVGILGALAQAQYEPLTDTRLHAIQQANAQGRHGLQPPWVSQQQLNRGLDPFEGMSLQQAEAWAKEKAAAASQYAKPIPQPEPMFNPVLLLLE